MDLIGYVSVEEADQYVVGHFVSSDETRTGWFGLSVNDREVLLARSFQVLEMLPFTGRKTDPKQTTAFPRWPSTEVPEAVKWAQIENALAKSDTQSEDDMKFYERLWQYGVESYTIGNLSERTSTGSYSAGLAQQTGIASVNAERLLRPYLRGGYRM